MEQAPLTKVYLAVRVMKIIWGNVVVPVLNKCKWTRSTKIKMQCKKHI